MSSENIQNHPTGRPWWYYIGFGVLLSAGIVGFFLASGGWRIGLLVALFVVGIVLDRVASRLGPRPAPRMSRQYILVWLGIVAVLAVILVATWLLVIGQGMSWVAWIAGLAAAVLVIGGGKISERFR
jgi:dipeptide/tripeptide permease